MPFAPSRVRRSSDATEKRSRARTFLADSAGRSPPSVYSEEDMSNATTPTLIVYARACRGRWYLQAEDGRHAGIVSGRLGAFANAIARRTLGAERVHIRPL